MTKKEDSISKLIDEVKDRVKDEKVLGLAIGGIIGYMLRDKLEGNPELRSTLLGAVSGEALTRLLGDGKDGK